jgi:transcriptional regulator with XRE-family HTH domain
MKKAKNIRHLRELLGLTQKDLARRIKASQPAVSSWERMNNQRSPSFRFASRISKLANKKGITIF